MHMATIRSIVVAGRRPRHYQRYPVITYITTTKTTTARRYYCSKRNFIFFFLLPIGTKYIINDRRDLK